LVFGLLNFTPMTLLPGLLQNLRGYPDSIIGLLLGARGAGTLLGFSILFFGNRYDPRIWLVCGFSLQGMAGWMMAQFDINLTTSDVAWAGFVQGLGTGFLWVPLTLVTFNTLSRELFPEGSSMFHLLRNIGSSVHISISVALVLHSAKINYGHLAEAVTPYAKAWQIPSVAGAWSMGSIQNLAHVSSEVQRQGLMIGYINAFYFYTLTALAALPLIMMVRMKKAGNLPAAKPPRQTLRTVKSIQNR
jgi:DHA2 family multidrug resistance protein